MGSFLFSDDSTPDLDDAFLANQDLLDAFRNLCYTEDTSGRGGSIRRPVDFGSLGSDELGSVYESLLELHPKIDTDEGPFTLGTASGNERKTTGSYYTPTSLINCLLDSALDPVVHAAIDVPDRAEAERKLLNLKVCDPACGSGHFLIAAAERMAMHLARLRTGDDEPNTLDVQHAKRDIIGRCIYGVDINPMAVELCKVALWMEAMEPGKPFSYLDHHIQCGNSLLGTTPALLAKGIPDDAFTPIEGDDRKFCSALKVDNKKQRKDVERGQTGFAFDNPFPAAHLGERMMSINEAPDDSLEQIERKRSLSKQFFSSPVWQDAYFWANYWCAAFVWKKDGSELAKQCPTERDFRRVERDGRKALLPYVSTEVDRLCEQYQFLHWHLAYPDVFRVPDKDERPENEQTGWNGGFDAVLGNPPWERVKLQEKEWFAERSTEIANASNAATRKRLVEGLSTSNPELHAQFLDAVRQAEGESFLLRQSGHYPLCARGDINVYTVFAETMRQILNPFGRAGCVLPSGIATDDTTKFFFQDVIETRSLVSLFDFENREGLFPAVDSRMKFCLFTVGSGLRPACEQPTFVFFAYQTEHVADPDRRFTLSEQEIALLNPSSGTCPTFRSRRDAVLVTAMTRRRPCFNASEGEWEPQFFKKMVDFGIHSHLIEFSDKRPGNDWVEIYEAKMIWFYNHRFSTYEGVSQSARDQIGTAREVTVDEVGRPYTRIVPRCWLRQSTFTDRMAGRGWSWRWFLSMRDITNATNERTGVFAIRPHTPAADVLPSIFPRGSASDIAFLAACLSSFALDFVLRQKVGGTHLSAFIVEQTPVIPKPILAAECLWQGDSQSRLTPLQFALPRVLELTYTAWDLEPFAQDCGYDGPPFRWDEERRFQLRAELDAAFFHLYLPSDAQGDWLPAANESPEDLARLKESFQQPRDAVSYIMDTFPIVRRKDIAKHGTYRTKDTILEIYDAMQTAIRTGIPYQTLLTPPPGPPTDANGQFIPFAQWTSHLNTSHIHPPREAVVKKPQVIVVDPVFPQTDLEKVLCACLLDFVTSQPSLKEDEYVDLMILAMQPANCRLLLTGDDRDRFDQSLKSVLPDLIADSDGKPPWRLLLSTLQANQSIQRDRFAPGANAQIVREKLPDVDGQFVALVLNAGERLRELQDAATPDPASARLVNSVRHHRTAAMTGAT